jgi:cyclic lactone autoinducer peptide
MKKLYLLLAAVATLAATFGSVFACQAAHYQPKKRE